MRDKVSGAIAIPRQAGDVPQPCRTGFGWFPKNHVSHETLLLERTVFHIRQKGVPPLLLPASVLQLPRCPVWICNLFHKSTQFRIGKFQKVQLQQGSQRLQNFVCSANVGCSPTPRQHFWKIVGSKNFLVACGSHLIAASEKIKNRIDKSTKVAYNNKEQQPFGCYKEKTEQ